jgi:hypothetical protein
MRDWRSGSEWDSRTLAELRYCRVRVVCQVCRHIADFDPSQLRPRQPERWNWQLLVPRFRCSVCGKRDAKAHTEPLPRD